MRGDVCGDIEFAVTPELKSCCVRFEKVVINGRFGLDDALLLRRLLFVDVEDEFDEEWFEEGLGEDKELLANADCCSTLLDNCGMPFGKIMGAEDLFKPKLAPNALGEITEGFVPPFAIGTKELVVELNTNGSRINGFVEMAM